MSRTHKALARFREECERWAKATKDGRFHPEPNIASTFPDPFLHPHAQDIKDEEKRKAGL